MEKDRDGRKANFTWRDSLPSAAAATTGIAGIQFYSLFAS